MRSHPGRYRVHEPKNYEHALEILNSSEETVRPLAGGTDLMVLFESGTLSCGEFLNIWQLDELKGIEIESNWVGLGALTTYSEIQQNDMLRQEFPMLCEAARQTGAIAIQNRGTLGGNIANASPAADSPPALLAYDAEIELVSSSGKRRIPYSQFHLGYKEKDLRSNELIRRVFLPRRNNRKKDRIHFYRKIGTRKAQAISKVCFSGLAEFDDFGVQSVKIILGSVAPTVLVCNETSRQVLSAPHDRAAAIVALRQEIKPIDDIRSNQKYRVWVSCQLLSQFIDKVCQRVGMD